jgi:hypothetical protein
MEKQLSIFEEAKAKPTNFLETKFCHKDWFIHGISKKLALQYFASTGDFQYNGSRIQYIGKEGGTYYLSKREQAYYEDLLKQVEDAKNYGLKFRENHDFKENNKTYFVFKNLIITIYPDWKWVPVSFKEYLQIECKQYYKEITESKEFLS